MVRTARPEDVPSLVSLVRELATYERAADQVRIDVVALNAALFTTNPKAHCLVVDADGEVAGMARGAVTPVQPPGCRPARRQSARRGV